MNLTAIILTYNESIHLDRCLQSLAGVASACVVIDCFSTDDTVAIAQAHGAKVLQHTWVNYATQFNWGLSQLGSSTDWVLRIDADEYLSAELAVAIKQHLPTMRADIDGVYCGRRMAFQGRMIRHGGLFPIQVIRLFRFGRGECENRWMDEHIKVAGNTATIPGELIDDNLNSLTWWTQKHNQYASREVVDLLNLKYQFTRLDSVARLSGGGQDSLKRWIKEVLYARMPGGLRAFVYFSYRYFIRLGFLDGREGRAFHVLQGFWYRYLVDAKLREVERYMRGQNCDAVEAINKVLGIKLNGD